MESSTDVLICSPLQLLAWSMCREHYQKTLPPLLLLLESAEDVCMSCPCHLPAPCGASRSVASSIGGTCLRFLGSGSVISRAT